MTLVLCLAPERADLSGHVWVFLLHGPLEVPCVKARGWWPWEVEREREREREKERERKREREGGREKEREKEGEKERKGGYNKFVYI